MPGGKGQSISLAGRRKKRHEKNIAVQAQILTALVTGDQVSYQEMESKFRKKQAKTAAANPWALSVGQQGASAVGEARGWAQWEVQPEPEPEPEGPVIGARNGRPHRRWFGYGPAPPVEPEPEAEPGPEPDYIPGGFSLHYPLGSHPPAPRPPTPEPEPEPYRSPLLDLPTGDYWLEAGWSSGAGGGAPPKCTCHPKNGVAGCRLHDPNYKHPNPKELQTPPSWMFKGNTTLNDEAAKIRDEYAEFVAQGGHKKAEKKRDAFLMRSFLMLQARLSFNQSADRGTFTSKAGAEKGKKNGGPGAFAFTPSVRCSYCGTVQKPYKEKRGRDYLIDADGNRIQLPRPEGLDWVQREIINDCGQLGPWDPDPKKPKSEEEALESESTDDEDDEADLDDPLALALLGAEGMPEEKKKKDTPGADKGDKPCLGLLQRTTLCPRHEAACVDQLDEAATSTVLLKSALWQALKDADQARRAHQLRHFRMAGNVGKASARFLALGAKKGGLKLRDVAQRELDKVKEKRAVAALEAQKTVADAYEAERAASAPKVGEAKHVSSKALVSASSGTGMRDLRTGKKLVW